MISSENINIITFTSKNGIIVRIEKDKIEYHDIYFHLLNIIYTFQPPNYDNINEINLSYYSWLLNLFFSEIKISGYIVKKIEAKDYYYMFWSFSLDDIHKSKEINIKEKWISFIDNGVIINNILIDIDNLLNIYK